MSSSSQNTSLLDTSFLKEPGEVKIAIVSTEWNEAIVAELIRGAERVIGAANNPAIIHWKVPGAVELTYACRRLLDQESGIDAIIAFGAVIRGGTPHFEYVCQSVTQGLTYLNCKGRAPIIFGVLTLDTEAQAWERLGGPYGHKGEEAAIAALKMIRLIRQSANSPVSQ